MQKGSREPFLTLYITITLLTLSEKDSKLSEIDFTLFIRSEQNWEKWWQCRRECTISSISKLQEHGEFKHPFKVF